MKNLAKIKYLPVVALLLGTTLAVATTNRTVAPQFYKNAQGAWQPLGDIEIGPDPGQYSCNSSTDQCTAEGLDGSGNPTGVVTQGQLVEN
ncbi:hypothetical protein [Dyadobacter sp. CY312]|uniref:hypothetical protein n=1 Tax=Dyadobacter sp. CY312 TaxID=2907303 RepID=UPI001F345DF7|nr:hypothetical protein [Dyadobacter sp. CY312]MCE7044462.1 hypothetical protein [Dyadobacter sp. CY312]